MQQLITDITIFALLMVVLTAFLGSIVNGIGNTFFSRGKSTEFTDASNAAQANWKSIGGTGK